MTLSLALILTVGPYMVVPRGGIRLNSTTLRRQLMPSTWFLRTHRDRQMDKYGCSRENVQHRRNLGNLCIMKVFLSTLPGIILGRVSCMYGTNIFLQIVDNPVYSVYNVYEHYIQNVHT